jgi:hypothetical protein
MTGKSKSASQSRSKAAVKEKNLTGIKKKRKNTNLSRLWKEMNHLSTDAVDKEIIKRFRTIIDTMEEDITKNNLSLIMKEPKNFDLNSLHEALQPYIKHYLFMSKRNQKIK